MNIISRRVTDQYGLSLKRSPAFLDQSVRKIKGEQFVLHGEMSVERFSAHHKMWPLTSSNNKLSLSQVCEKVSYSLTMELK